MVCFVCGETIYRDFMVCFVWIDMIRKKEFLHIFLFCKWICRFWWPFFLKFWFFFHLFSLNPLSILSHFNEFFSLSWIVYTSLSFLNPLSYLSIFQFYFLSYFLNSLSSHLNPFPTSLKAFCPKNLFQPTLKQAKLFSHTIFYSTSHSIKRSISKKESTKQIHELDFLQVYTNRNWPSQKTNLVV